MEYFIVFCAAFVGSGLKAVGGFGFATLTTPTVSLFWDVPTAIVVIYLTAGERVMQQKKDFQFFFLFFFLAL